MNKETILNAEERWARAFLELDLETIAELMDDDYTPIQVGDK